MFEQSSSQRSDLFTLYQVRLRAEEIDFVSNEAYSTDLQRQIDASFEKLNHDYEIQKSAITREAKIAYSVAKNENRISVLQSQQDTVERALDAARARLAAFRASDAYAGVLCALIRQGLDALGERSAVIRVVAGDAAAAADCLQRLSGLGYDASVDAAPLPDSALGGAVIASAAGTISVDNSFEGRLSLARDRSLPQIARILHTE